MKQINLPMKKSFLEFMSLCEAVYDKDVMGRSQIKRTGQGGRIDPNVRKKTDVEIRRVKAVGGGKTAPVQSYKDRKDIGTQKPRSQREQQPEKERGTAGLSAREQQRKAAIERRAARSGVKTKTASELLATKTKKTIDPKYKPQKASGMTQSEREAVTKKGEKKLRDIRLQTTGKTKESELKYPITKKEIARRRKASK